MILLFRDMTHKEYEQFEDIQTENFPPLFKEAVKEAWTKDTKDKVFILKKIIRNVALFVFLIIVVAPVFYFLRYKVKKYYKKYPENFI